MSRAEERERERGREKQSSFLPYSRCDRNRSDYHHADARHTNDCVIIGYARIALSRSVYELVLDSTLECNENRTSSVVHSASAADRKYRIGSDKLAEN